ncbi:MAG: CYTH domain-containing protein [Paludibacteraceae bacterium]|jgi:CYTH domain-containing protein|nr:CYTH domain-containing protein [Paludibacteraceae bacterium]MEE0911542.1 CYTH domain-containing protein [Paludibacteraceae bacterium]
MNIEIERKFLLKNDNWREGAVGVHYKQAYLNEKGDNTVRVRIEGEKAKLTIKGKSSNISRLEFEYDIPMEDAEALFTLAKTPIVEKYRYKIMYAGNCWEVDEFLGLNRGLVVAEIELESETQSFEKPDWIGMEVSGDKRYTNANLARKPYCEW